MDIAWGILKLAGARLLDPFIFVPLLAAWAIWLRPGGPTLGGLLLRVIPLVLAASAVSEVYYYAILPNRTGAASLRWAGAAALGAALVTAALYGLVRALRRPGAVG